MCSNIKNTSWIQDFKDNDSIHLIRRNGIMFSTYLEINVVQETILCNGSLLKPLHFVVSPCFLISLNSWIALFVYPRIMKEQATTFNLPQYTKPSSVYELTMHIPNPVFRYDCALLIYFLLLENFHMFFVMSIDIFKTQTMQWHSEIYLPNAYVSAI